MKSLLSLWRSLGCALATFTIWLAPHIQAQSPVGLPAVGIKVVREETMEPSPLPRVAPGEFVIYRDGSNSEELSVFIDLDGSATPGLDYEAPEKVVHFESGQSEVRLLIGAVDDSIMEGDETVAILLPPPPTDGPPTYTIKSDASAVKIVIHDNDAEPPAVIKITSPRSGAEIPAGQDVEISGIAVDPAGYIATVEFYVDGSLLDTSVVYFIRAPDPGTLIEHGVLWKSPAPGKHELVARGKDSRGVIVSSEAVVVLIGTGDETLVSIRATDPQSTELPAILSSIDPLEFEISRTGSTQGALIVFFSLHGSASKEDYFEVPTSIIIPSGSPSATLQIVPKADLLKILEPMETVGIRLEPSPMAGPLRTYGVDPSNSTAAGVIYEQHPPGAPAVELVFPDQGHGFELGAPINLLAASYTPEGALMVDFYDGEQKLRSVLVTTDASEQKPAPVAFHPFTWAGASSGEHTITARTTLADGQQIVSAPVLIVVKDSSVGQAQIRILEPMDGQIFPANDTVQIAAIAVDPEGYILRVEFFANDEKIGESEIAFFRAPDHGTPITHTFSWENVPVGTYLLTVRGLDSSGRKVTSFPVKIAVGRPGGSEAKLEIISPKSGEIFESGAEIPITAVAVDPQGYIPRVEFYANERLIGVSEIVFIRAPDNGTPITHTTLWGSVPAGEYVLTARAVDSQGKGLSSAPVKIVVGGGVGAGDQVVLMVEALDPVGAEVTAQGDPDNAAFVIRRIGGRKDIEVPISFRLAGTASNGSDYEEVKEQTILPAGSESIEVVIKPVPDKAIDPDETVELHLVEPVCPAIFPPPPQCYRIAKARSARVVIRKQSTGAEDRPTVTIVPPAEGSKMSRGLPLEIRADASAQGKPCVLETTTDLQVWTAVAPVILPDGQLTYVTETGTDSQRYYRLRVQ